MLCKCHADVDIPTWYEKALSSLGFSGRGVCDECSGFALYAIDKLSFSGIKTVGESDSKSQCSEVWLSDALLFFLFAQEHRGLLAIRYPMEHGIVKDWNDMERIWQYVYSKDQLQTFSEEVRDHVM